MSLSTSSRRTPVETDVSQLWEDALQRYEVETGNKLFELPTAKGFPSRPGSVDEVIEHFREQNEPVKAFRTSGQKVLGVLKPTVRVMLMLLERETDAQGTSTLWLGSNAVLVATGVLLQAVREMKDLYDDIVSLFLKMNACLEHVEVFAQPSYSSNTPTKNHLVSVLIEVLTVLGIVTKYCDQANGDGGKSGRRAILRPWKSSFRGILGHKDVKDALQKLEELATVKLRAAVESTTLARVIIPPDSTDYERARMILDDTSKHFRERRDQEANAIDGFILDLESTAIVQPFLKDIVAVSKATFSLILPQEAVELTSFPGVILTLLEGMKDMLTTLMDLRDFDDLGSNSGFVRCIRDMSREITECGSFAEGYFRDRRHGHLTDAGLHEIQHAAQLKSRFRERLVDLNLPVALHNARQVSRLSSVLNVSDRSGYAANPYNGRGVFPETRARQDLDASLVEDLPLRHSPVADAAVTAPSQHDMMLALESGIHQGMLSDSAARSKQPGLVSPQTPHHQDEQGSHEFPRLFRDERSGIASSTDIALPVPTVPLVPVPALHQLSVQPRVRPDGIARYRALQQRVVKPAELRERETTQKVVVVEDAIQRSMDKLPQLPNDTQTSLLTGLTDIAKAPEVHDVLEKGANHFLRTLPAFIDALDQIGKVHPIVAGVVLIFKCAYTLERRRRDNDKKVRALFDEMKQMLEILIDLDSIPPSQALTKDSRSLNVQNLRDHLDKAEVNIQECANACDAYAKKGLFAKVFQCISWNTLFAEFSEEFKARRDELRFDVSVLTAHKVSNVEQNVQLLIDIITEDNHILSNGAEMSMRDAIVQHGNEAILQDEGKLLAVFAQTGFVSSSEPQGIKSARHHSYGVQSSIDEARESPSDAIARNRTGFKLKFDFLHEHIDDAMRLITYESNRILCALKDGIHRRLQDQVIHHLWEQHRWGGTVKTHHFIVALREHYLNNLPDQPEDIIWALQYLDVRFARPIAEALDEDASGFVTVAEMNQFLQMKPTSWSLPFYVAYWAIGWRQLQIKYSRSIAAHAERIRLLTAEVRDENRGALNNYLSRTVYASHAFTDTLARQPLDLDEIPSAFIGHAARQESIIVQKLERLGYIIDSRGIPEVIMGTNRLEEYGLILLDLILARHVQLITDARENVVSDAEFAQAALSLEFVADAFVQRAGRISHGLVLQRLDLKVEFRSFAFGLFQYAHDPDHFHKDPLEPLTGSLDTESAIERRLDLIHEEQQNILAAVTRLQSQ